MAEIQVLNTPLMSLLKGISGGGQAYLQTKTEEEERRRAKMMQDLQSFIAMMPYLQATPDAVAPTPGGIPGAANSVLNLFGQGQGAPVGSEPGVVPSMTNAVQSLLTPPAPGGPAGYGGVGTPAAPPAEPIPGVGGVPNTKSIKTPPNIQDIMQSLYGSKYTLGPSAAMRQATTAAEIGEATKDSTVKTANMQPELTQGAIDANAQNRTIGGQTIKINDQTIADKPITGKQKYVAEEADNWVSSVISDQLPLNPKNRQAIINATYNAYRNNAPDNIYKSQVTREDFAGVVDAKLKQQADDELKKQLARIASSRGGGAPDYLTGLKETRLSIQSMLSDFEKVNGDLAPFITMQREGKAVKIPPELQGQWNKYTTAQNVQRMLAQASAEVAMTGSMSAKGQIALGTAIQLLGGEEVTGIGGGSGGTPPATGYDAGEEWLKSKYPTRPEAIAALNMMVKNGQVSKDEATELNYRIQKWPR